MKNLFRKTHAMRGSHLPVLMKLVRITPGPILELGCGMYSTPFLHWACYPTKRQLVTLENNPDYREFAERFRTDFHEVRMVEDWEKEDFTGPWSIVLVDHSPEDRRHLDIARVVHADYVVAHDADNSMDERYQYSKVNRLFKYRWKYSDARPKTAVFSNRWDLSRFNVL